MLRRSQVVDSLEASPKLGRPAVLTIGNFDGVHLGHQAVIQKALTSGKEHHLPVVVLTFRNHPSTVLKPDNHIIPLSSPEHKLKLIEALGVDLIVAMAFTKELADQSVETFLNHVRHAIPFSHIVLGHDACIGKNREGNKHTVQGLAKLWGFDVLYLEPLQNHGMTVSSTRVRQALQKGHLDEAEGLLGRRPSYFGKIVPGLAIGRKIGFPTFNLDVADLCLPPLGVYAVTVTTNSGRFEGIANLGMAPTVRADGRVLLETYLFDYPEGRSEKFIEVSLHAFIRPEAKFDTVDALKQQVAKDITQARLVLRFEPRSGN